MYLNIPIPKHIPLFGVVLLHGCMAAKNELYLIASKVRTRFGSNVLIIQPTCRTKTKSVTCSIESQAKKVYKEIQDQLGSNKTTKSLPICIIGYSQGGLVACMLGDKYRDQLNIYGIVTWNAPLGGVPVLNKHYNDIQEFINNAQDGLQLITSRTSANIKRNMKLATCVLGIIRRIPLLCLDSGLQDMLPNSSCIQHVRKFLHESNHGIPCLLIASHENDFRRLFTNLVLDDDNHEKIEAFNKAYAKYITNSPDGLHDTLIPLKSQLCREDRFNGLTISIKGNSSIVGTIPGRSNVKERIYGNTVHAGNLIVMDPNLFINSNYIEVTIYAKKICSDIIVFINEVLIQ